MRFHAFIGSREYPWLNIVRDELEALPAGVVIVSGGARGVDRYAESVALEQGRVVGVFYPPWDAKGLAAGPIRNAVLPHVATACTAFWDGKRKGPRGGESGTLGAVGFMQRAGVPVRLYGPRGEVLDVEEVL